MDTKSGILITEASELRALAIKRAEQAKHDKRAVNLACHIHEHMMPLCDKETIGAMFSGPHSAIFSCVIGGTRYDVMVSVNAAQLVREGAAPEAVGLPSGFKSAVSEYEAEHGPRAREAPDA